MKSPGERRRHPGDSFLDLPREIRDAVYEYIPNNSGVFTYDLQAILTEPPWVTDWVGSTLDGSHSEKLFGNQAVAFGKGQNAFAILLTCRTIYSEALPVLYRATPLGMWRPMYDYGGREEYPTFVAKMFQSLPIHAGQHIRTLQLQGEYWHKNMQMLLTTAARHLPSLKVIDVALDPYYTSNQRDRWLDDRAVSRQLWPAIATLSSQAQQLEAINFTLAPPADMLYIWQNYHHRICLSGELYKKFVWAYMQMTTLRYELTMFGGIIHADPKKGMEFFMDVLGERRDLFEICQRGPMAEEHVSSLLRFRLEDERDWFRRLIGRDMEVDVEGKGISMVSSRNAGVKWCKMTYTASPRGHVRIQEA